jgi:16S rRNA (uracil1498-N3)-methyltransferase
VGGDHLHVVVKPPLRLPLEAVAPGLHALPLEAAAYATRVHRLGLGDRILVFDPALAVEADAEIVDVGRRVVAVRVGALRPASLRSVRAVTLLQGIGKGDKLDAIVRDATELGATRIVPVICERSVARPPAGRATRWRRIAVEAARQCGRGDAPVIDVPLGFADALALVRDPPALSLCLDPTAREPLGAALAGLADPSRSVAIAVGPEGGLTPEELAEANAAGFVRVTLGPLTLRTETVCAAVLGALLALSIHRED